MKCFLALKTEGSRRGVVIGALSYAAESWSVFGFSWFEIKRLHLPTHHLDTCHRMIKEEGLFSPSRTENPSELQAAGLWITLPSLSLAQFLDWAKLIMPAASDLALPLQSTRLHTRLNVNGCHHVKDEYLNPQCKVIGLHFFSLSTHDPFLPHAHHSTAYILWSF